MSEDEATEKLKRLVVRCKECKFATCENCEINWNEVQAIEIILNELDTLQNAFNTSVEHQTELIRKNSHLRYELFNNQKELEKKDKIINAMAEYISNSDNDEIICKATKCEDEGCKNCIKQYFERNVEK